MLNVSVATAPVPSLHLLLFSGFSVRHVTHTSLTIMWHPIDVEYKKNILEIGTSLRNSEFQSYRALGLLYASYQLQEEDEYKTFMQP